MTVGEGRSCVAMWASSQRERCVPRLKVASVLGTLWEASVTGGERAWEKADEVQVESGEAGCGGWWFFIVTVDHNSCSFLSLGWYYCGYVFVFLKFLNFHSSILNYLWLGWDAVWDLLQSSAWCGQWMGVRREQCWPCVERCGGWVMGIWRSMCYFV